MLARAAGTRKKTVAAVVTTYRPRALHGEEPAKARRLTWKAGARRVEA
jgi:hypothetical protein